MPSESSLRYMRLLLDPYSEYYSNGFLNSEGLTLLGIIAREVLREYPWLRGRFAKARSRRDFETVSRLINEILDYQ
jgi:hypothetical protein